MPRRDGMAVWKDASNVRPQASVQSRLLPVILYVNTWVRIQIRHTFLFPIRSATHMSCVAATVSQQCLCLPSFIRSLTLYTFLFFKLLISRICITQVFYRFVLYDRDRSVGIGTMLGATQPKNTSPSRSPVGCKQSPL